MPPRDVKIIGGILSKLQLTMVGSAAAMVVIVVLSIMIIVLIMIEGGLNSGVLSAPCRCSP